MNLAHFGVGTGNRRRKTLVILGAGASRGASFAQERPAILPPLDLDFFQQLSRLRSCDAASRLISFIRREFGTEVGLSMEQFFSEADYTDRFHRDLKVDPGPLVKRYQNALGAFYESLPVLLEASTTRECRYHARLASLLNTDDCVMSFNYDCIVDRALRLHTAKRWDPEKGSYGFTPAGGWERWRDHSTGRAVKRTIRLLKMHGSCNWVRNQDDEIELGASKDVDSLRGVIIPPTWFKDLVQHPYQEIWKAARKEIRSARIIVVIGYSVPATDLFSRSLLKVEAGSKQKREKLDLVVLVNPDRAARATFLDLVSGALEESTRILECDTFAELAYIWQRYAPDGSYRGREHVTVDSKLKAWVAEGIVDSVLGRLTDDQREVLRLRYGRSGMEGLSQEQVANRTGRTTSQVQTLEEEAHSLLESVMTNVGRA